MPHRKKAHEHEAKPVSPEADPAPPEAAAEAALEASGPSPAEREAAEWKDRALRAAADLDNYRKRSFKEREDAAARAQGEVLARIVEVVDDLARVAHLEPSKSSAESLHEGMLAIERKFLKLLEGAGVERIDAAGKAFDPHLHEAVATLPAQAAQQDHTVGAVYQNGYTFKGTLLRPARVAVLTWNAGATAAASAPATPAASRDGHETPRVSGDSDLGGEG